MMSDDVTTAVLATLAYSHQFHYPLSLPELQQRLITGSKDLTSAITSTIAGTSRSATKTSSTTLGQLKKIVARLIEQGRVTKDEKQSWVALVTGGAGKKSKNIYVARQLAAQRSKLKWVEVDRLVWWLHFMPFIQAVAITGSLAVDNVSPHDDIDVMIVTTPHRLWLTRVMVLLLAQLMGKRRSWQREEPDSWCFNLWLDTQHLAVPLNQHSLYIAYEVVQARWIYDRAGIEQHFRLQNAWIKNWLPNWRWPKTKPEVVVSGQRRGRGQTESRVQTMRRIDQNTSLVQFGQRPLSWFLTNFDQVAYKLQRWYMASHQTRERVERGVAFFHPRDTRAIIEKRWQQTLQSQLSKIWSLPAPIAHLIDTALAAHQKIVLVTGVFDVLHQEHQEFLRRAKQVGDVLLVGLESDVRVKQLKGPTRPIHNQEQRRVQLQHLGLADGVFILPEKFSTSTEHLHLIQVIKPAVLAVSSHSPHLAAKRAIMQQVGGRIEVVHDHNPQVSSTILIEKGYNTST